MSTKRLVLKLLKERDWDGLERLARRMAEFERRSRDELQALTAEEIKRARESEERLHG